MRGDLLVHLSKTGTKMCACTHEAAVLLEKVDPHKRTLAVFVQEELSNKLQLGGGLRHASSVHPADSQPDTDQRVPAQSASRNKDDTASGSSGKLEAKAAKPAVPKSQEEFLQRRQNGQPRGVLGSAAPP